MPLRDDLLAGLRAADAAGDTEAAQHFASQLKTLPAPVASAPTGRNLAADRLAAANPASTWEDEVEGVVGGVDAALRGKNSKYGQTTFSGGYDRAVNAAREGNEAYQTARPLENMGLSVLGSLPTIALAAPETLAAKAGLGAKMLQAAKTGAKVSAVIGAGTGTDATSRTGGAATGGLLGLATGLLPVVPAAVRGVKNAVTSLRQPAEEFAQHALASALTKDSVGALDAAKPLIDQIPVEGNATALGEQAALEGEGRTQANKFFKSDAKAREGTILGAVKNVVSDAPMYDVMDDLHAQRTADAKPLYEKAYAAPYRRTPRLMDLLSRPSTGAALRAAYTRLQDDPNLDPAEIKETLGPIMGSNPDDLSDAQLAQRMTQAMGNRPLEFKALDYVKRGLDAMVQDNPAAARETRQLRNVYRDELKNINPNYQAALNAWAGPSSVLDAVTQGREFDSLDPEFIQRTLGNMSDSEQQGFQVGVSRRLQDLASGAGTRQPGQNTSLSLAKGIEGNAVMQRRLQAALGSNGQSAPQLLQRNGWRSVGNGVFENTTKPGTQITVNTDGTWNAGQLSKSGKSTSLVNAGHNVSTLESFLTGKPSVVKPGATSVDDLIQMSQDLVHRAQKNAIITGNSSTARRQAGAQMFDNAGDAATSIVSGPYGMAKLALKTAAAKYLSGLTSARRAAVSRLLYSNDPVDNQAAIDAIEKIRAGRVPTLLQQRLQKVGTIAPAAIGVEAGQGANN